LNSWIRASPGLSKILELAVHFGFDRCGIIQNIVEF